MSEKDEKLEKMSDSRKSKAIPGDIGSEEFYQGERIIEDITLPGEKRNIKAETVSKEEIYEDKTKKQEAFIQRLGRKEEVKESKEKYPEYIEKKSALGKKIIFSVLAIFVLGALAGGGYWFFLRVKPASPSQQNEGQIVIPINQEPLQEEPEEEQPVPEEEKIEAIKPAEIKIKVLNEGATGGSAGKIKDLLASKGYEKAEAGNGELDSTGSFVYYSGDKFKASAEAIKGVLSENKIEAAVKEALTSEQKSADIVVILGKS